MDLKELFFLKKKLQIIVLWYLQERRLLAKYTHSVEFKSLHESFTMPPKKLEIRLSTKFNGYGLPLTMHVCQDFVKIFHS
jgi:hypothetical protein